MFKTKKRWLFPVLGILLASLTAHAEDVGSFKHFLVGGDPVPQGKLEAVGRLPGCTATLIGPQTVLTAAHCVCAGQTTPTGCDTQQSFTLVNVRPVDDPTTATDESATRRDITMRGSVRIHPSYTSDGWLSHDFAIVDLNQPASDLVLNVQPIPVELPTKRPKLGDKLTLVGFGRTGTGCDSPPMGKRQITLPLHEISTGNVTLRIGTSTMGSCPGDSGGPALNAEGNIVGVSSTSPGNYDPTDLAYNWIYPDTFSVNANGIHGSHFENRDRHQFYLVSAYPLTVNGRLTYQWDNVRDPGESRFIRRLNIMNLSSFQISFKLKVHPLSLGNVQHAVEIDTVDSVAANGKHGFHFERGDQHQFYLVSVYPTTVNGRVSYEWDNVRDPGESAFIRRLNVINKSNFPVTFKLKAIKVFVDRPLHLGEGLVETGHFEVTSSVAANGKHGFHFERRDQHQFYLVSAYPTTVNGRITYEWDNVRDPGESAFIRRLNVINKSDFPVTFKLKVIGVTSGFVSVQSRRD